MKFSRLLIILFFTIIFFVNVAASENLNSTDFNLTSDNTIFVNSSYVGWFEDGSQAHPYKSVSNGVNAISKHSSKSNLCIAEGEYKISKALTFRNNVNIIGSGDNVILNAKGLSTVFKFYQGTYSISNIKITNANAMISHSSSDGAAIFINSSYVSNRWVSLDVFSLIIRNCVFENNSGYNGGAIYAGNGNLTIINSSFISNKGVYGGALYVEGCNVLIDNVNFYNNSASKDGGGVYTNNSYLTVSNSKINYNMAVNGAGAYLSFGVMNLSNLTFIGNTANGSSSNGGGLYLYESCGNINNSYFYRNKVLGDIISSSAIFNVNSLGLNIFNTIISNNYLKGKYGFGSVISNTGLLSISNSSIINNEMFVSNDIDDLIYNPNGILTFNDNIVKDNYFSLGNNSNTFYAIFDAYLTGNIYDDINIIIPKTYDLRNITLTNGSNVSWVTSVKDQGSYGTCWAFAALDALESNILMNTGEYYNFSVSNLVNIMGKYGDEGYDFDGRYGGSYYLSSAYLTRWDGPVNESDNPYKPYSKYSPNNLTTIKHVQDILFIPLRQNISDLDAIKIAILKYGALAVIYRSTSSNYVSSDYNPNIYEPLPGEAIHAVVLVGWDDNYSASNFNSRYGQPIGNGAFIIKNSWGSNVGDDGYYYISYYDLSLASCGGYGFTGMAYNNVENIDNYKNIYEYDPLGNTIAFMGFNNESAWFSNVFTSISDNPLQAFTIITPSANSNYEVKVYVNNELKFDGNGIIVEPGYHTIKLDKYVPLDIGDVFKIVVKLTTPNFYYPIAIETNISGMSSKATAQSGQSYISKDGNNWYDISKKTNVILNENNYYDEVSLKGTNVCLKAFTANLNDINLTCDNFTSVYGEVRNLTGKITDIDGNPISGQHIKLNLTRLSSGASKVYNVVSDYKGIFRLEINLAPGDYTAKAEFDGYNNYKYAHTSIMPVKVKSDNRTNTILTVTYDEISKYGNKNILSGKLTLEDNTPLIGRTTHLKIIRLSSGASKTYNLITNNAGEFSMSLELAKGEYYIKCSYDGEILYYPSSLNCKLTII